MPKSRDSLGGSEAVDFGATADSVAQLASKLKDPRIFLGRAAAAVAPMARQFLLANVTASGLARRTGGLAAAVGAATVSLGRRGLVVAIPGGFSDQRYRQVASLNYGSVRQSRPRRAILTSLGGRRGTRKAGVLGGAAKRTLKKMALGQAISGRAAEGLGKAIRGGFTGGVALQGGASVIPPRNFFKFNPGQEAALRNAFLDNAAWLIGAARQ